MYTAWRSVRIPISVTRRLAVCKVEDALAKRPSSSRPQPHVATKSPPVPSKAKPRALESLQDIEQSQTSNCARILPGDFVELKSGDFLKVTATFQDTDGPPYEEGVIQGFRFRKTDTDEAFNFLGKGTKNLYLNLYMNALGGKSEVKASDILCKKNLILTSSASHQKTLSAISDSKVFCCDWTLVYRIKDAYFRSELSKKNDRSLDDLWSLYGGHIERFAYVPFNSVTEGQDIGKNLPEWSDRYIEHHLTEPCGGQIQGILDEDVSLTSALGALRVDDKQHRQPASKSSHQ